MGVVAYRAPMAAVKLSIESGTCPAPVLPALRLTSAMVSRGARVVGTPLLVWEAWPLILKWVMESRDSVLLLVD